MPETKSKGKQDTQVKEVIDTLKELNEDSSIPKNVKLKIGGTIKILEQDLDPSIKVNKALHFLDEVSDDSNLQPYTRTQIWNIVSMLEKI